MLRRLAGGPSPPSPPAATRGDRGWTAFQRFVGYDDASLADFQAGIADRMVTHRGVIAARARPPA
ncbi:MAG: hypothetical protein R3C32_01305 [Chloroflexota bacterium]